MAGNDYDQIHTREEHLKWCKKRAIEALAYGAPVDAVASMLSDLGKHSQTNHLVEIGGMLMLTVRDRESAIRFVEGFN